MHARRVGYLVICASLLAVGGTQASASTTVSGNPAVIAYFRLVSAASQRMAAQELTITGEAAIKDYVSRQSWDVTTADTVGAPVPSGYVPAVQYITVAAEAGRITWISSVIVPAGCPSANTPRCPGTANNVPALFLLTSAGFFIHPYRYPDLCWSKGKGSVDGWSETGGPFGYELYGDYVSMRRVGASIQVVSTYAVGGGQTATETDTVDVATHLPTSTFINVPAASGHQGYTQHWTNRWLTTAPSQPQVGALCS